MKRKPIAVLFFLVSLMATSCSKIDALFNNGEPITEQRNISQPFNAICMYDNINVKLVYSNHPHLELTCPKNLIDNIVTEVQNDSLMIWNDNDLNWIRSFNYDIDLTVYYDSLREITYASTGQLNCIDSIKGLSGQTIDSTELGIENNQNRNFVLRIKEGSGDINLCFDCDVLKTVFSFGTSTVTLQGSAGYTEHYMKSYGTIHAESLNSNIVSIFSESTNDIYVWAQTKLTARIYSIGNVYYKGHPWIEKAITGEGQIIQLQ